MHTVVVPKDMASPILRFAARIILETLYEGRLVSLAHITL